MYFPKLVPWLIPTSLCLSLSLKKTGLRGQKLLDTIIPFDRFACFYSVSLLESQVLQVRDYVLNPVSWTQ